MSKGLNKVLYLCGVIEPHREGISKEAFMLHESFKSSYLLGISPGSMPTLSKKKRFLGLPSRGIYALRYLVGLFAPNYDVIHIFHGIDCYHYLKAKTKKPIILTAVSVETILSLDHYEEIKAIVVESERDRTKLIMGGLSPAKIYVIYPGYDLSEFHDYSHPPQGKFKVLFASSPFSVDYMASRGVRILLEAASIQTNVDFTLLWRKRGNTLPLLKEWIANLGLTNVEIIHEDISDMAAFYRRHHCVVAPFTTTKGTKSCPNSVVEGLAVGRPALVSTEIGISNIIEEYGCGVVFDISAEGLANGIEKLRMDYNLYQINSRKCAKECFDKNAFIQSYANLYQTIAKSRPVGLGK